MTSGLSILLHGDISLPDATSCDKHSFACDIVIISIHKCSDIYQFKIRFALPIFKITHDDNILIGQAKMIVSLVGR